MRGNIQGLIAQAQKMQKNMERVQAELASIEVTGEAGAGLVKVTMTCKHEVRGVAIDPSVLSGEADDKEMLEDLIAAAINDAAHKVEAATQAKMREATAGMPLPPGMKMPF
ncbi:MAG: YbaB/EbfC family nucleoid-associated protein [Duodenibacillus sp.]|nr:YbaB/EbfC family nucleoid-associated protein [Duodenibacillus sp.]